MFTAIMRAFFSRREFLNLSPAIGTCLLTSDLPTLLVVLPAAHCRTTAPASACPIPYLPQV